MYLHKRFQAILLIASILCSTVLCRAEITISLTKGFVKKIKDKATVTTTFRVDKHHNKANPVGTGSDDGDIHIAGRDNVVLLPMVAEIVNGRRETDTLDFLLKTSAGQSVNVVGVWRLWFEHPGNKDQTQGDPVPVPKNTNPDHIFELHPLAEFAGFNCRDSFLPIVNNVVNPTKEFRGHPASKAFPSYEARTVTITRSNTAIMITSAQAGFNYADFDIKLEGKPKDVGDGFIVLAKIFEAGKSDTDDPLVEENRRMIFVKDTPPADAVKALNKGDTLHVVGIPRVNLNAVFAIASGLQGDEEFSDQLPYEMIIVTVIPK